MTSPVTLNLGSSSNTTAARYLRYHQPSGEQLGLESGRHHGERFGRQPAGRSPIAYGNKMNVQVTGDTANSLGFGSFAAGADPTQAQYSTITGTGFDTSTALGTAQLGFSINGGASNGSNQVERRPERRRRHRGHRSGNGLHCPQRRLTATICTISIDGGTAVRRQHRSGRNGHAIAAAAINTAAAGVTATVNSSGHLVMTANAAGAHTVTLANGANGMR